MKPKMNLPTGPASWILPTAMLALVLAVAAADRPAPRIAVVDAERIRNESAFVRGRLAEISKPAEEIKARLLTKRQEVQSAIDQYQAQAAALSDDAKKARAAEITKMRDESEALSESFTEALGRAQTEDVEFIRTHIMDIVKGLANERQVDVVISTQNVLYNAPAADLTSAVIERLDAGVAR